MEIDYLIVGQGLAGSLLAWELIGRQRRVIVLDSGLENASQIAAGLINPITGMRFVKTVGVDACLPVAKNCYSALETFFGQVFYVEKPMLKIFRSHQEAINALKRLNDMEYRSYLDHIETTSAYAPEIMTPHGFLMQKQTGYVLTKPLLSNLKAFFIAQNSYRLGELDYRDIQFNPVLRWQDVTPKRIIFCEGYHATNNLWFSWLPFQPVKGEILTYQSKNTVADTILNYGYWLIPLNGNTVRIGASFDRENLNNLPTQEAKQTLLMQFKAVNIDFAQHTLQNHQAGIRPCTLDKQPFIGHHPRYPQLSLFNGFGAKGSLLIPWCSRHFADFLLKGETLAKTCDLQRYVATHYLKPA